jgi:uncharacterized protein YjbJ (UPF0337 family)
MNNDQIEGKWKQLAGSFREKFGRFTKDDITQLNGQREQLIGKLQEKYGDSRENAELRYNEWASSLHDLKDARKKFAAGSGKSF